VFFLGVFEENISTQLSNFARLTDSCLSLSHEYHVRACIFGLSATFYPVFRAALLSTNFGIDSKLQTCNHASVPANLIKSKLYGTVKYCSLLFGNMSEQLVAIPLHSPFVQWCSNFVSNRATESERLRVLACVRGSAHFAYEQLEPDAYCAELLDAPSWWSPKELLEHCRRTFSWDFNNISSHWSALIDVR